MTDQLKNYLLADRSTRVIAVHLSDTWRTGLQHQELPEPVRDLLGELVAAATLLCANLKFDGSLVLQLQGGGPVSLMVVECTAALQVRATATLRDGMDMPAEASLQSLVNPDGDGRFAVVLDPGHNAEGMQPYQGIVPLEGDTVAQVLQDYMRLSEQLDTRLWLAADETRSAGLLLQRMPAHGGHQAQPAEKGQHDAPVESPEAPDSGTGPAAHAETGPAAETPADPDNDPYPRGDTHPAADTEPDADQRRDATWHELLQLGGTLAADELLNTSTDTLIHRLFWQHDLLAVSSRPVSWHCPCSRQRVTDMLRMLGREEIMSVVDERGSIDVACNFCGKPYTFDAIDCTRLFMDQSTSVNTSSSVH